MVNIAMGASLMHGFMMNGADEWNNRKEEGGRRQTAENKLCSWVSEKSENRWSRKRKAIDFTGMLAL